MKRSLIILIALICSIANSQAQTTSEVKVNVAAGAMAIFNPSIELGFGNCSAITLDYIGAFANDNWMGTDMPLILSMGVMGYRHYLEKGTHKGFFAGGDLGFNSFRMNKNIAPLAANDSGANVYDVGRGTVIGMTLGYKFIFKERWGLEINGSGGWQHSWHEKYYSGVRLVEMNRSAEWLIYKGGIYLSYRL